MRELSILVLQLMNPFIPIYELGNSFEKRSPLYNVNEFVHSYRIFEFSNNQIIFYRDEYHDNGERSEDEIEWQNLFVFQERIFGAR